MPKQKSKLVLTKRASAYNNRRDSLSLSLSFSIRNREQQVAMQMRVIARKQSETPRSTLDPYNTRPIFMRNLGRRTGSLYYTLCLFFPPLPSPPPFLLTQVSSGVLSGILNISPEKIQAVDMDSINAPIHYSFLSGNPPNYREFFEINPNTGAVKQIKAVDTTVTKRFDIIIKVSGSSLFYLFLPFFFYRNFFKEEVWQFPRVILYLLSYFDKYRVKFLLRARKTIDPIFLDTTRKALRRRLKINTCL